MKHLPPGLTARNMLLAMFMAMAVAVPLLVTDLALGQPYGGATFGQPYANTPNCTGAGCAWPSTGVPALSGACVTAGGGSSSIAADASNFYGSFLCTSTTNASATLAWSVPRNTVPSCVIGGTGAGIAVTVRTLTTLTFTYTTLPSGSFSYICLGN